MLPASSEYWHLLNIPCHRRPRRHHGGMWPPPAAHLPGTGWRGAAGRVKGEGSVCLVQILSTRASDAGRVEVGRRVSDALSPAPSPSLYRGEAEALGGRPTLELAERLDAGSRLPRRRGLWVCSCRLSRTGAREPALLPRGLGEPMETPTPSRPEPAHSRSGCGVRERLSPWELSAWERRHGSGHRVAGGVGALGAAGAAWPPVPAAAWRVAGVARPSAQRPQWGLKGPPSASPVGWGEAPRNV